MRAAGEKGEKESTIVAIFEVLVRGREKYICARLEAEAMALSDSDASVSSVRCIIYHRHPPTPTPNFSCFAFPGHNASQPPTTLPLDKQSAFSVLSVLSAPLRGRQEEERWRREGEGEGARSELVCDLRGEEGGSGVEKGRER